MADMQLSKFVEETIKEVCNGVEAAKRTATNWVAPGYVDGDKVFSEKKINFEITVTYGTDAKGGVKILAIGEIGAGVSREAVNRISFSVPVYFQGSNRSEP